MTRRWMHGFAPLFAILSALVPAFVAVPTDACENAVLATDERIAGVKAAEKLLNEGKPVEARDKVQEIMGSADQFDERTPSAKGLTQRAQRILALATVRIDDRKGEYRKAVLSNAVVYLTWIAKDSPNDPAKNTDLGEALAKTNPPKAKKILEDLASRDVITTPYGYAALARLRAADKDDKGRDEAIAKCKQMAKVESICSLQPAKANKS